MRHDSQPPSVALRPLLALLFALCFAGCAGRKAVAPQVSWHGPQVSVARAAAAADRAGACERVHGRRIVDDNLGAADAGMLPGDYLAVKATVVQERVNATFRDSNPACGPHLAAGVQSKPHAILQKSWNEDNLPPADRQLAGLISDRMAKPPKGEIIADPQLTLYRGAPVTCDYDLMDLIETDGRRVPGESERELEIRAAFNRAVPATPEGHRDRVMHGSQAAYGDYLRMHPEEEPVDSLFKPEAPLTAFTADGTVYRLPTLPDAFDFYRCTGAGSPPEWNPVMEPAGENR